MSANLLLSFLPILIVLLSVILVIFIGRSIKRIFNQRGKYATNYTVKWFLGAYFSFLLISIILYMLIPKGNTIEWQGIREEDVDQAANDFHQAAFSGNINTFDTAILEKQWKFDYHNPQLKLQVANGENVDFSIFVEVKDTKDGKIEVYQYRRASLMSAIIVEKLKPMNIYLTGDTLFVTKPDPVRVKFSLFNKEFPVTQFTGESLSLDSSGFLRMEDILYLRIPKDLDGVDQGDLYIERVRKEP